MDSRTDCRPKSFIFSRASERMIGFKSFISLRFQRLKNLRIVYFVTTFIGIAMILSLHNFLVAKHFDSNGMLKALVDHYIGNVDRSCVATISGNIEVVHQIRKTLRNFPSHHPKVVQLMHEAFKDCVKDPKEEKSLRCFVRRSLLTEYRTINFDISPPALADIEERYQDILKDGFYPGPPDCEQPEYSTLFILPYRDRESHLRYWLHYTIEALLKQKLRFQILLVEQEAGYIFNKGQLMNTGFAWAMENTAYRWDCVVLHDVDMISELYGTLYRCKSKKMVIHYARYIDKFNYTVTGSIGLTVGGAVGFTERQYLLVNGYSNVYWGWGGEDDDMYKRIRERKLKLVRYKKPYGRFKMVPHERDKGNPSNEIRYDLLKNATSRMSNDGLSNLKTKVLAVERHVTHTKLLVKVNLDHMVTLQRPTKTLANVVTQPSEEAT